MIINSTDSFTILKPKNDENANKNKIIVNFHHDFIEKYTNFKDVNLILDFSNIINLELQEILLFSQNNKVHKNNKKSFVLVVNGIKFDHLPDEMVVVPTLTEAKDIVELENIERDLGI